VVGTPLRFFMKDFLIGLFILCLVPFYPLIRWLARPRNEDDKWP